MNDVELVEEGNIIKVIFRTVSLGFITDVQGYYSWNIGLDSVEANDLLDLKTLDKVMLGIVSKAIDEKKKGVVIPNHKGQIGNLFSEEEWRTHLMHLDPSGNFYSLDIPYPQSE